MKASNILFFLLVCVSLLSCKQNDNITVESVQDLEDLIEDEMDFQDIPGLAILIFQQDNLLYENYFGKSDISRGKALSGDQPFLIASISKSITATALMQLWEEGKFQLDDPINDHLSFSVNSPHSVTAITFRMLLNHTSGIADNENVQDGQYYWGQDSPVTLKSFLQDYFTPGGAHYNAQENFHTFQPGSRHEYSNIGSALVGLLVEEISGIDFNTYCKNNIFQPLCMNNTAWKLSELDTNTIVRPYFYDNGFQPLGHYTFTDYPNGGLRTSARDLSHFLSAFALGNESLLKQSTMDEMLKLQAPGIDQTVGLGMYLMDTQHQLWGHDGGEQGVSTTMAFHPGNGIGVIILTNGEDVDLDELQKKAYELGQRLSSKGKIGC